MKSHMQCLVMPDSKKCGFVELVPNANSIGLLLVSLVMESKSFFSGVGKQTHTWKQNQTGKKKTYRKRSYPCYRAIGPRPTPHNLQDNTKSHYTESFLLLKWVSSQKAATLFAQVGNSLICQNKVPYGSAPHLPSYTKGVQHRFEFPPAPPLVCLILVDHKPCG